MLDDPPSVPVAATLNELIVGATFVAEYVKAAVDDRPLESVAVMVTGTGAAVCSVGV